MSKANAEIDAEKVQKEPIAGASSRCSNHESETHSKEHLLLIIDNQPKNDSLRSSKPFQGF